MVRLSKRFKISFLIRFRPQGVAQPLHSQQSVGAEVKAWSTEWMAHSHAPLPIRPGFIGEPLPPLCVDAALRACDTFAARCWQWPRVGPDPSARLETALVLGAGLIAVHMYAR